MQLGKRASNQVREPAVFSFVGLKKDFSRIHMSMGEPGSEGGVDSTLHSVGFNGAFTDEKYDHDYSF
jgi:hypothetical protein